MWYKCVRHHVSASLAPPMAACCLTAQSFIEIECLCLHAPVLSRAASRQLLVSVMTQSIRIAFGGSVVCSSQGHAALRWPWWPRHVHKGEKQPTVKSTPLYCPPAPSLVSTQVKLFSTGPLVLFVLLHCFVQSCLQITQVCGQKKKIVEGYPCS